MLDLIEHNRGKVTVLVAKGQINRTTAPQFANYLGDLLARDRFRLVLEMAEVKFIGSAGLRAMVAAVKTVRQQGGDVRLAAPSQKVMDILKIVGMLSIFDHFNTLEEAIASF